MKIPKGLPQPIRSMLLRGDKLDLVNIGGAILHAEGDDKVTARDAQQLKAIGSLPTSAFYHSGTWKKDPHPKTLVGLVAKDAERTLGLSIKVDSDIQGVSFTVKKDIEIHHLEGRKQPGARTTWGSIPVSTVYARRIDSHLGSGETTRLGGTIDLRIGKTRISVDVPPGTEKRHIPDLIGRALEKKKLGAEWMGTLLVFAPKK
jgi:hypothetical protein